MNTDLADLAWRVHVAQAAYEAAREAEEQAAALLRQCETERHDAVGALKDAEHALVLHARSHIEAVK